MIVIQEKSALHANGRKDYLKALKAVYHKLILTYRNNKNASQEEKKSEIENARKDYNLAKNDSRRNLY